MPRIATILLLSFLAIAACAKKSDDAGGKTAGSGTSSAQKEGAADLEALAKLKDELCACKDRTCGNAVGETIDAKYKAMHVAYASSRNKSIMHYASETQRAAMECQFKLK